MPKDDGPAERVLRRIADTLGISVERFHAEAPLEPLVGTRECLRLWSEIRIDAGRAAALDALRRVLDEEAR